MSQIFRIMIRCPETGRVLDTGITTTGREALSSDLFEEGKILCTDCNQSHGFKEHAFYQVDRDSLPAGPWRPNP